MSVAELLAGGHIATTEAKAGLDTGPGTETWARLGARPYRSWHHGGMADEL